MLNDRNGALNGAVGGQPGPAAPIAPFPPMKSGGNGVAGRAQVRFPSPGNGARNGAANGARLDADEVIARLEEAGETLLCLPAGGYTTALRTSTWTVLQEAAEAYGREGAGVRLRPPVPSAAKITRMDQVHRVEDAYLALPVEARSSAQGRAIRADIAELRVSLWAQHLGTPHPVSEKRLLDRIAACAHT